MFVPRVVVIISVALILGRTGAASAQVADAVAPACVEQAPPPLRVVLRAMAPAAARVLEAVRAEVTAIWHRQGVPIEWVAAAPVVVSDSPPLHVTLQDDPRRRPLPTAAPALAAIGFANGRPGRTIVASTGSAAELLGRGLRHYGILPLASVDFMRSGGFQWLTARLTGWAVAHEIGHYVLATARHDDAGLMRIRFDPRDVLGSSRSAVTLAPPSAQRLLARMHPCLDGLARPAAR